MKCPACKNPLREKGAGDMTLDICYGGCGGIWFDATELQRVSARAATTLHSIWNVPRANVKLTEPRLCPRCPEQKLDCKWFSDLKRVEIDQCPKCGGIWLDAGEFSRIYDEIQGAKVTPPGWATAMAEAAGLVQKNWVPPTNPAMPDFLFELPLAVTGPMIIGGLCLFGIGGLLMVRRFVLPRLRVYREDSEFSGAMIQCVMVFYGLAVALIAVNVSQTYSDVSKTVSEEADAVDALYRDVSSYPEPIRQELQQALRDYTDEIIHQAWPLMQHGQTPTAGFAYISRFQAILDKFEPSTEGQKLLHGEALRAFNLLIQTRRERLDAASTNLPGVMWAVVLVGAIIGLCSTFFFKVEDIRLHGILVTLLAVFMGLVIFMILALDRPFEGDLGISPQPYQLIYDMLMKP